jgi:hypothetical protein
MAVRAPVLILDEGIVEMDWGEGQRQRTRGEGESLMKVEPLFRA